MRSIRALHRKINRNADRISRELSNQTNRIKEEIARQLFQEEGYYEVANEYDQEVQKALKIR